MNRAYGLSVPMLNAAPVLKVRCNRRVQTRSMLRRQGRDRPPFGELIEDHDRDRNPGGEPYRCSTGRWLQPAQ